MSFESTPRTIAVDAVTAANLFTYLTQQYGEFLPTGNGSSIIRTIGAFWDDVTQTRLWAANPATGSIAGQRLTDGRVAFTCLWQSDVARAFDAGQLQGNIQQLSYDELKPLLPQVD